MRYLCLIYNSADRDGTLTQAEGHQLVAAHFQFDEGLRADGTMIYADALESPETATVLRMRDNQLLATAMAPMSKPRSILPASTSSKPQMMPRQRKLPPESRRPATVLSKSGRCGF